ncbi:hypothetical protein B296_00019332 [Ensete ventricosum]|uniref:Uncharacterized protein n=1 Tax=Ensete ventricosum TaxID=4639 RepID=A0A427B2U4_ENSVE|nr:hypothetical protein B296_00019332 [Ensete ventricosum]
MPSKSLIPPPYLNPTLPRRNAPDAPSSMCVNDLDPRSAAPQLGGPHHRRAHSELAFRISEDLHLGPVTEDDVFRTFMDVEKIGSGVEDGAAPALEAFGHSLSRDRMAVDCSSGNEETRAQGNAAGGDGRPTHRHGSSVDVSTSRGEGVSGDVMEAKKAMPPEKLAELAVIDPKRAKRFALPPNWKIVSFCTSILFSLCHDKFLYHGNILSKSNHDVAAGVSDALKQEVERLQIVTGGKVNKSEAYNLGLLNLPYSSLVMPSEEQPKTHPQGLECHAQFCQSQLYQNDVPSDMMQQGHLKVLPGLNIRKGSIKCSQSRELYRCKEKKSIIATLLLHTLSSSNTVAAGGCLLFCALGLLLRPPLHRSLTQPACGGNTIVFALFLPSSAAFFSRCHLPFCLADPTACLRCQPSTPHCYLPSLLFSAHISPVAPNRITSATLLFPISPIVDLVVVIAVSSHAIVAAQPPSSSPASSSSLDPAAPLLPLPRRTPLLNGPYCSLGSSSSSDPAARRTPLLPYCSPTSSSSTPAKIRGCSPCCHCPRNPHCYCSNHSLLPPLSLLLPPPSTACSPTQQCPPLSQCCHTQ